MNTNKPDLKIGKKIAKIGVTKIEVRSFIMHNKCRLLERLGNFEP